MDQKKRQRLLELKAGMIYTLEEAIKYLENVVENFNPRDSYLDRFQKGIYVRQGLCSLFMGISRKEFHEFLLWKLLLQSTGRRTGYHWAPIQYNMNYDVNEQVIPRISWCADQLKYLDSLNIVEFGDWVTRDKGDAFVHSMVWRMKRIYNDRGGTDSITYKEMHDSLVLYVEQGTMQPAVQKL